MAFAWLPLIFYGVFLILLAVLLVKGVKWLVQRGNGAVLEKIAVDSVQLQKDSLQQQRQLIDELIEVNNRLVAVEKVLQDVE